MICPNCNYLFDLPPVDPLNVAHQYCPRCWCGIVNPYPNPPWHDIREWLHDCHRRKRVLSEEQVDALVEDCFTAVKAMSAKDIVSIMYGRYTAAQVDELVAKALHETPRREIFAQAPAAQILRDTPDAGIIPLDYTDLPFVE
jgi:hypothetical protein